MDEFVSKKLLVAKFNELASKYIDRDKRQRGLAYTTAADMIALADAADVQPVKRGRWIGIYEYCEKNGYVPSGMGIYYWCSECDKAEQKTSEYCPHCGARMDLKGGDANG